MSDGFKSRQNVGTLTTHEVHARKKPSAQCTEGLFHKGLSTRVRRDQLIGMEYVPPLMVIVFANASCMEPTNVPTTYPPETGSM